MKSRRNDSGGGWGSFVLTGMLCPVMSPVAMMASRVVFVVLLSALCVSACVPSDGDRERSPVPTPSITTADGPAWSYDGATGPEQWADLSDKYAACDGDRQSPIALADAETASDPSFRTLYVHDKGTVVDTGHSLQVNTTGGMLTSDGTVYDLREFHAHAPSEHTVDGTTYAAELHLVYKAGDRLAILAVLVEEGSSPHPTMEVWAMAPDTTVTLNAGQIQPKGQGYYTYEGSLTTPPCSEPVRWFVMDAPIQASSKQLKALRAQYDNNNRPLQPLGDRTLKHVTP